LVPQASRFLLLLQRSSAEAFEKYLAQCLNHRMIQRGKKARKRRAMRETVSPKGRHERGSEGLYALIEHF
jgi:hypothetical protein